VSKSDDFDMLDKAYTLSWNTEPEFLSHEL